MKMRWIGLFCFCCLNVRATAFCLPSTDSLGISKTITDSKVFYDSLFQRAHRHALTGWLYDILVCEPRRWDDHELKSYEYYRQFEGKIIASITIKPLDVFGPSFDDTTQTTNIWIEKAANSLHTKSNLNVIRRNLFIREGQVIRVENLMDNERLLRRLPYLKDARVILNSQVNNPELVDVTILTKDVFSFGVTGKFKEIDTGSLNIYNKNIFGIGHELSVNFVGHTTRKPNLGVELFYKINAVKGFLNNLTFGYANTYLREGYGVGYSKEFLRQTTSWGGGVAMQQFFRTDRIYPSDPVRTDYPLSYQYYDIWYGHRIKFGLTNEDSRLQCVLSGRIRDMHFSDRPAADETGRQYFANSTFYLASLSFSQRRYIRDLLVYSYGITEDIPRGFLHEFVVGYDNNEFTSRWYSHVYLSSGNIFKYREDYLFAATGFGGFFNSRRFEQGMLEVDIDYISKLFDIGTVKARQFVKLNYDLGIRRFEVENMLLRYRTGIRGFESTEARGKQRLNLNLETVLFQNKSILNFNIAIFPFIDLGIIGSNRKIIFTQDYYSGIGVGMRIRNENLVFNALQIRLAYYPNHPADVGGIGFAMEEQLKTQFYSFQPREPEILRFE